MGNLKVTMTDSAGKVHEFTDVAEGQNLMEVGKAHGVAGIFGDCGGGCACATCHVYIGEGWAEKVGQPDDIEFAMLDMVSDVARENSRLGCQVRMTAALDGLSVTVAPTAA